MEGAADRPGHRLPPTGAAAVDRALYFVGEAVPVREIDRQVETRQGSTTRSRPNAAGSRPRRSGTVKVHLGAIDHDGLVPITAMADVPDAVAFEDHVATRRRDGPTIPLPGHAGRWSWGCSAAGTVMRPGVEGSAPGVMVFVHTRPGRAMADVDLLVDHHRPEQVQEWVHGPAPRSPIRPVIDLAEEMTTDAHAPPSGWSSRSSSWFASARSPAATAPPATGAKKRKKRDGSGQRHDEQEHGSDLDHRREWPEGQTTSSNLYPPCRGHHRLKTFTDWTYQYDPVTGFTWSSPLGYTYTGPGGRSRHPG